MRNYKNLKLFSAALLVALAAQTSEAQTKRQQTAANQGGPIDVIALQTYVEGRSDTYGVKPAEPIPVNPGDRIRIHLVGTAIINGNGVEREMPARFSVVAGGGHVDIVQSGASWALVQVKSRGDGTAQLGYEVTGNSYEMKGGLREGRITLQIGEGGLSSSPGSVGTGAVDRARWTRARELTDQLYRSIAGVSPQGEVAQRDLEHVYEMGLVGVRDVALALVNDTNARYDRLAQNDAIQVAGDLYRGLLRRNVSNEQLWNEDSGFRANVEALRRHGYGRLVQTILDAPEFRSVNNLAEFGSMAGFSNNSNWRSQPSRYAVRN